MRPGVNSDMRIVDVLQEEPGRFLDPALIQQMLDAGRPKNRYLVQRLELLLRQNATAAQLLPSLRELTQLVTGRFEWPPTQPPL